MAKVKWDSIRGTVLSAACDVLLVLDCCAAGGANLRHVDWQPPPGTERYTKHLFAACGFESSTRDNMTAAMCEVLEFWEPPPLPAAPSAASGPATATARRSSSAASSRGRTPPPPLQAAHSSPASVAGAAAAGGAGAAVGGGCRSSAFGGGQFLTTKRLHQLMEDKLQKRSVGSQPIFKQLLPHDPEQYITLPNLRERDLKMGERRGRRGYVLA